MTDGYIRWYRESGATSVFAEQTALFAAHGISLAHPGTGAAVVLDIEGEHVPMEEAELGRLLGLRIASLTMNWWFDPDTNVVDEFVYEPLGCEIQTLWLDGLTHEEAGRLEAAVLAAAAELPVPTRALVIDRRGESDPEDWDSLVLYGGATVPGFPDAVFAREPVLEQLLRAVPGLVGEPGPHSLTRLARARPA